MQEVEFVFEPQDDGGYHVYAPELPGLHTQGDDLEEATENVREALALYVEGPREDGRSLKSILDPPRSCDDPLNAYGGQSPP